MESDNTAGTTARASAELQQTLGNLSLPAIKEALAAFQADLGAPGQEPASIKKAYGEVRTGLRDDYAANRARSSAYIKQQALQSGMNYSPGAVNEALGNLSQGLRASEASQLRALNFQEAQSGMNQTNSLISNITGTAGRALSGSLAFGSNALQSDQLAAQYEAQARQQNTTYGAMAGTILGSLFGGVGAPIGGAIGGAFGGLW